MLDMDTAEFEHIKIIEAQKTSISIKYAFIKRFLDIFVSAFSILLLSPLLLAISLVIRLTSEGPAIYKQNRIGKDGRTFAIYKFRSMIVGADNLENSLSPELLEYYKVNRKIDNDPRITKVGKFLRRTSLDELPQIFNIFKGEMTLVGPRPMLPDEIEMYGWHFELYKSVKPGLTGLWQIKCRSETKMEDRAKLDYEYIRNQKLSYDLHILLKTFSVVLSKKGAC